jgi:hypothetical protein
MLIETMSVFCGVTNPKANVTSTTVTEPVPSATTPTGYSTTNVGDGLIAYGHGSGGAVSNAMKLWFFGVGSDSTTFSAYVYGWELLQGALPGTTNLWMPTLLATFTGITLDAAQPGIANSYVPATNYFASAITLGVGNSGISVEVVSPGHAAHEIAHAVIDVKGARIVEVRYATGSSATSCNGIWKKL